MDLGLKDKRVVVTGSSRGIGFAIARTFLEEGALVLINGVDENRLLQARERLAAFEGRVSAVAADISASTGIARFFEEIDAAWGGLDILVNNAAIFPPSDFATLKEAEWDRVMDANVKSIYLCAQQAYKRMKGQEGGVIINASSFAAYIAAYPRSLYSVSKAAVLSLTRAMAAEFAPAGIRVNAYVPGAIVTEANSDARRSDDLARAQAALQRPGTVDEVAAPVVFLASPKASYITGAALEISGGKFAVQYPKAVWDRASSMFTE